jgi:hypothetical protein
MRTRGPHISHNRGALEVQYSCNLFTAVENRFETPETVGYLLEAGRDFFIEAPARWEFAEKVAT